METVVVLLKYGHVIGVAKTIERGKFLCETDSEAPLLWVQRHLNETDWFSEEYDLLLFPLVAEKKENNMTSNLKEDRYLWDDTHPDEWTQEELE